MPARAGTGPRAQAARLDDGRGTAIRRQVRAALRSEGPPLVAVCVGVAFLCVRFATLAGRLPRWADFSRRDSGQYLSIARRGYWTRTTHCIAGGHRHPHLCGNVTWFPGYPALIRGLSEVTRVALPYAAIAITWACWWVVLRQVWRLTGDRGGQQRWLCLGIATFFPGQVYFGTIFPLSMAVGAALLCIESATVTDRRRWALPAGFVAGTSYLALVLVAPALLVGAVVGVKRRVTMGAAAAAVLAGFGAVLLYAQLSVGRWNAYFITEKQVYGVGVHHPWSSLVRHLRPLWKTIANKAGADPAEQSLLVFALMLTAIVWTCWGLWRERTAAALDVVLLCAAGAMALLPYLAGGALSVYRAEGCVIVVVPLLRRAPRVLLVALLAACVVIAFLMSGLFQRNILG